MINKNNPTSVVYIFKLHIYWRQICYEVDGENWKLYITTRPSLATFLYFPLWKPIGFADFLVWILTLEANDVFDQDFSLLRHQYPSYYIHVCNVYLQYFFIVNQMHITQQGSIYKASFVQFYPTLSLNPQNC